MNDTVGRLDVWLVRHGESAWNAEGRIQGQSDSPLSTHGVAQARALALRLRGVRIDWVYTSDLRRAVDTARIAIPWATPCHDARLRERSMGVLEGKLRNELDLGEQELLRAWDKERFARRVPEGESFSDLVRRAQAWFSDLPRTGRVVAFTHAGPILALAQGVVGARIDPSWHLDVANTSVTRLTQAKGVLRVDAVGDADHLANLGAPVQQGLGRVHLRGGGRRRGR